jgi:ribosomal protein S18 acetylase RimI-like enzyme
VSLPVGKLTHAEIEDVVALWEACGLTRPWNDPRADARLALAGPASTILVIRIEGRIAASAMVGHNGHRAWAYYVSVHPDYRRKNLGRKVMAACEQWARQHGMPKIQILVRNENLVATGFYGSLGYERDEVVALSKWLGDDAAGRPDKPRPHTKTRP